MISMTLTVLSETPVQLRICVNKSVTKLIGS